MCLMAICLVMNRCQIDRYNWLIQMSFEILNPSAKTFSQNKVTFTGLGRHIFWGGGAIQTLTAPLLSEVSNSPGPPGCLGNSDSKGVLKLPFFPPQLLSPAHPLSSIKAIFQKQKTNHIT